MTAVSGQSEVGPLEGESLIQLAHFVPFALLAFDCRTSSIQYDDNSESRAVSKNRHGTREQS